MTEETITIGALAECLVRCEASDLQLLPPRRVDGPLGPATALWVCEARGGVAMTTAKEHAEEAHRRALCAELREGYALEAESVDGFFADAQASQRNWMQALISLLRFVDALPEPVAIPPVPQPSEEAKRRGVLVGAVVRDVFGDVGRVVSHGSGGLPLVQWRDAVTRCGTDHLTVIRPAPTVREPNAEAVKRGLYIGARVVADGEECGEVVGWDSAGDPIVEHERWCAAYIASDVTLAGDAS